jgi:hypothetical protein
VQGQLEWPYGIDIPPGGDTAVNYFRPYGVIYGRILHRDGDAPGEPPESVERAFANVTKADAHPAVMVAQCSQGNYPASSRIRVADWSSCPLGESIGDVTLAGGPDRPGPPAPPQQGIWYDPFGTIFGSGDRHEGEAP